jgi:hypothetical protein
VGKDSVTEADDVGRKENLYSFVGLRDAVCDGSRVEVETGMVSIFFDRLSLWPGGTSLVQEEKKDEPGTIENR